MQSLPMPPSQIRLAGVAYLIIILCGVSAEAVLRGPLIDQASGDAAAAAILSDPFRFRLSILADAVMALSDVTLAVLLFGLFRQVSPALALAAMIFRLVQAAVIAANLLNLQLALLLLQSGAAQQQTDLALIHIALHAYGYDLGLVFFGVSCLLTAGLIWRSGVVPRLLGSGIALSGLVYLAGSTLRFTAPDLAEPFALAYVVPLVAETTFCLWLLIVPGAKTGPARISA